MCLCLDERAFNVSNLRYIRASQAHILFVVLLIFFSLLLRAVIFVAFFFETKNRGLVYGAADFLHNLHADTLYCVYFYGAIRRAKMIFAFEQFSFQGHHLQSFMTAVNFDFANEKPNNNQRHRHTHTHTKPEVLKQ